MKKTLFQILAVALLLISIATSCKEPVDGVNLDKESLYVAVGKTAILKASIVPSNATNQNVSWESSNPAVATVDNGKVSGKTIGKTTITVKTEEGARTAKCFVTVVLPIEPEMIKVEGGTFFMGCTDGECQNNELPTHEVTLTGFNISKYPITQKEWIATMSNNPSNYKSDNYPVEMVTYDDIQIFIQRLNDLSGKNYRLPTEAEWEYAARGGNKSKGYKYSGSDNVNDVAWINGSTHIVGTKEPNELGIYDMSGNVFEFCNDWYGLYTGVSQTNPQGPPSGSGHSVRGGNYGNVELYSRVAFRMPMPITYPKAPNVGFRLVLPEK